MGGDYCALFNCNSSRFQLKKWKLETCVEHPNTTHSNCPCKPPYQLLKFPDDEEVRRKWCSIIFRKDFKPTKNSRVCSLHFAGGRPTANSPYPHLNLGHQVKGVKVPTVRKPPLKRSRKAMSQINPMENSENVLDLKKDKEFRAALPMLLKSIENIGLNESIIGLNSDRNPKGEAEDMKIAEDEQTLNDCSESHAAMDLDCDFSYEQCSASEALKSGSSGDLLLGSTSGIDLSLENQKFDAAHDHGYGKDRKNYVFVTKYIRVRTNTSAEFLNDKDCKFLTGMSLKVFHKVCFCLHNTYKMKKIGFLSKNDTLLLFFMRLRLGSLFGDLGIRFGVHQTTACRIFNFWLPKATAAFKELVCWLPNEVIKSTMPTSFKVSHPNTTCIIDGTEVFVQRPLNLRARSQVFSNYKKHSTVKLLIAIAPSGYIMFISQLYGGKASDKFILNSSGFLNVLEPGMEVMADRGYPCGAELSAKSVGLNTPAFTVRGVKFFPPPKLTGTRRVASVRIHVERAINRLKNFRILKNVFPIKSIDSIESIVLCCAGIANLQPLLIQRKFGSREKVPKFLTKRKSR